MEQRRPWARRLGGAVLSSVEPAPARFVLPQLYYPWLWEARFRLTIIPVALGVVAPLSSSLYELRPRLVMIAGMAICIAALVVLITTLTGAPPRTLPDMKIALAAFVTVDQSRDHAKGWRARFQRPTGVTIKPSQ